MRLDKQNFGGHLLKVGQIYSILSILTSLSTKDCWVLFKAFVPPPRPVQHYGSRIVIWIPFMPNRFALLYECKAPLDAHQLAIFLFLLQYLTWNSAELDRGTGKEEEKRQRNGTEIEKDKQWKTRQPAATPVKTKQKTIHGLCGESSLRATWSTWKQTTREKTHKQKKNPQVAAIAYNTTVDIDDLKPQDNTTTA